MLLAAGAIYCPSPSMAQEVFANSSAAASRVDLHTLRAIFGMRLTEWPNGTRITVYVMDPDSDLHNRFAKRKLQLFPYQLTQAWDRLVFSGTGQAPLQVRSAIEMQRRLLETPGAIGYLPANMNPDDLTNLEVVE